jgi:3-oxoacyl-[acyl-carrier-protein] synthase-3
MKFGKEIRKMRSAGIIGTGLYLPEEVRTNDWFKDFDLSSSGEIFDEAGVEERRVCAKDENASDMEAKALLSAVENAGISIRPLSKVFFSF